MPSTTALQSGSVLGVILFFFLLVLVATVGLILWTYQDAQVNSSQSAALWALVVFFAPMLGVLLYLLVGVTLDR